MREFNVQARHPERPEQEGDVWVGNPGKEPLAASHQMRHEDGTRQMQREGRIVDALDGAPVELSESFLRRSRDGVDKMIVERFLFREGAALADTFLG